MRGALLPSKAEIVSHWKDRLRDLDIFIDWSEPSCWACGFRYGRRYDVAALSAGWERALRCWERVPLQRCHIVPRSLGGGDHPSNLFLMCRECHDLAPNTAIKDIFFEWVRAQSHYKREQMKYADAFRAFGVDEASQPDVLRVMQRDDFSAWVEGKYGLHRPQSNYAPLSSRMTPSTMIGLAVHYMRGGKA